MDTKLQKELEKIHRDSILFDGLLMWGNLDSRKTIQEMIEGNLAGGNYTVANHSHDFKAAIASILKYRKVIQENNDLLALALNTEDIKKAQKNRKLGVVFGFQDTRAVEEVEQLEVFKALGVRIVQLTYNAQNLAGTGCCAHPRRISHQEPEPHLRGPEPDQRAHRPRARP